MAKLTVKFDAQISEALSKLKELESANEEAKRKAAVPYHDRRAAQEALTTAKVQQESAARAAAEAASAAKVQQAHVTAAEAAVKAAEARGKGVAQATRELEKEKLKLEQLQQLAAVRQKISSASAVNLANVTANAGATNAFTELRAKARDAATGIAGYFHRTGQSIRNVFSGLKGVLAGALAFAGISTGIGALSQLVNRLDNLGKHARNLGVTASELRGLEYAAASCNVEFQQVETAMQKAMKTIGNAANGNAEAAKKLSRLGLTVEELKGKNAKEVFDRIAEAINAISDPAEKSAASMAIFEEAGGKMLDFLANYQTAAANVPGGPFSDASVKAAEELNQACTDIKESLASWAVNSGLLTQLRDLAEGLLALQTNADLAKRKMVSIQPPPWYLRMIGKGWLWGADESMKTGPATDAEKQSKRKEMNDRKDRTEELARRRKEAEEQALAEDAQKQIDLENEARKQVEDQITALEKKLKYQQMINAGKEREAEIERAIDEAAKAAEAAGVELSDAQKQQIATLTGQMYDLNKAKSQQQNFTPKTNTQVFSDSLLRIGGRIGGSAQQISVQQKSLSQLQSLNTQVQSIKQTIAKQSTTTTQLTF